MIPPKITLHDPRETTLHEYQQQIMPSHVVASGFPPTIEMKVVQGVRATIKREELQDYEDYRRRCLRELELTNMYPQVLDAWQRYKMILALCH
jgi:hypothetical protein